MISNTSTHKHSRAATATLTILAMLLLDCTTNRSEGQAGSQAPARRVEATPLSNTPPPGRELATFAGGCFWCTEATFEHVRGVVEVVSGYTGGAEVAPTYAQVSAGETGHAESIRVVFDPAVVTYAQLLDVFWRSHDPTTRDRSFHDEGHQYRSAIFVHSPSQRRAAEASLRAVDASRRFDAPVVTEIRDAGPFWAAEAYHQNYYRTHPDSYHAYRTGSGRDAFITRVWGEGALEAAEQHRN